MGNIGSMTRYIGGKKPLKYFREEIFSKHPQFFFRLGLDEGKGFCVFIAFVRLDKDRSGTASIKECMDFFGNSDNLYVRRMFDVANIRMHADGLNFFEFAYTLWNFCTLYTTIMAKHMFEVFDPDGGGYIERADVGAWYRMINETEYEDDAVIDAFPYTPDDGRLSRSNFISHIRANRPLIKPITSFQARVRQQCGGVHMWEGVTQYRKRQFFDLDESSRTLDEALVRILKTEVELPLTTEQRFQQQFKGELEQLYHKVAKLKEELLPEDRGVLRDRHKSNLNLDENVRLHWMSFEAQATAFVEEVYPYSNAGKADRRASRGADDGRRRAAPEAPLRRHADRLRVFEALDRAIEVTEAYWSNRNNAALRGLQLTSIGTGLTSSGAAHLQQDVNARIKDMLSTETGRMEFERFEVLSLLGIVRSRMAKTVDRDEHPMYEAVDSVYRILETSTAALSTARDIARALSRWTERIKARQGLHERFADYILQRAIGDIRARQTTEAEARAVQYRVDEDQLVDRIGSRTTRWERLYDGRARKHVSVNIDTFELLPEGFCVCEKCDNLLAPGDPRCFECFMERSERNKKLVLADTINSITNSVDPLGNSRSFNLTSTISQESPPSVPPLY